MLFFLPYWWSDRAAGLLFALAGITDSIDGWLARRTGAESRLGAFLDPVADKLVVATALILVVARDQRWYVVLPAVVIVGREIAISALREWMAEIGARRKVAVSTIGKFKTIAQVVGIAMLLYREDLLFLPIYSLGLALTVVAAALTLWSMVWYLRVAWPDLTGDASP
jgi:CDP-diacylglycerol--glycerol-3-phosphate 3-phosphatidyltransferase